MPLPNLQVDRQALERLQESHPELESVHQITALKEEEFIQTYAGAFAGDVQQARRVYRLAEEIQQHTALLWANLKDIASPFIQNTTFNNIPASFLEHQQAIPGYDRLFGNLDYVDCEPCRSVFGPAAYFVDLMRFIEETITNRNSIPPEHQLERRRPDLFSLKLDCANTSELIAYIDLVNEVLETIVANPEQPNADQVVEAANFPSNLPFNLPLEQIRTYLSQLKLNLSEIYQAFETTSPTKAMDSARESLALSPREFDIIRTELTSSSDVLQYYGLNGTQTFERLTLVSTFLQQTGLSRQELTNLLFQDLSQEEVSHGLARRFFINQAEDGLDYLQIEEAAPDPNSFYQVPEERLVNLSIAKLDLIHRFVKLARKLGWTFIDLDQALRSLHPNQFQERVLRFDGINDGVIVEDVTKLNLTEFTIEAWVHPDRAKANPILYKGIYLDEEVAENASRTHFLLGLDANNHLILVSDRHTLQGSIALPLNQFSHVAVTIAANQVTFYINGESENLQIYRVNPAILPQLIALGFPQPAVDALRAFEEHAYTQEPFLSLLQTNLGAEFGNDQVAILRAARGTSPEFSPVGTTLILGADCGSGSFAGIVQEVRIWQGVRQADAIAIDRWRRLTGQEPGLVAYWALVEENLGEENTIQVSDRTPNPTHGVLGSAGTTSRPQWVPNQLELGTLPIPFDGSYQFNGVDQYLAAQEVQGLEINQSTGNQFTVEAWVNLAGNQGNTISRIRRDNSEQPEFEWGVTASGSLAILANGSFHQANGTIQLNQFTHVAVTLNGRQVQFYVNGQIAGNGTLPAAIAIIGFDLEIGRNLSGDYFNGQLREVRFWNRIRTPEQIQQTMHQVLPRRAEGLIGYWRLNQIEAGRAIDLSYNQNHLYLGGIPANFMPDRIQVDRLLPDPIAITSPVLELDGTNDVIVVSNPQNAGLGQYERFTLELWFRPLDLATRVNRQQVIYSQGDAEAGLTIYLFEQRLYVLAWCEEGEQTVVQETIFQSNPLQADTWHHVAVTNDETQSRRFVEFRAFLDGTELTLDSSTLANPNRQDHQRGYRLRQTGVAYLGGIGEGGMTRFAGAISSNNVHAHYFGGQITDFRLWQRVKTVAEINADRLIAPSLPDSDLVAYLPLDESEGNVFGDRSGNGFAGRLQERNLVFLTDTTDPELENWHSHYNPSDVNVTSWTNYAYLGRMRVPEQANAALGVTFFSRHPKNIDQYYRLEWSVRENQPAFRLAAHPQGVQPLTIVTGATGVPATERDRWHQFRIEVEDNPTANRTEIRVKVWLDGTPEPAAFQLEAHDDSDIRITSGTIGIWAAGNSGSRQFDDLQVLPLTNGGPNGVSDSPIPLLTETFETYTSDQNPAGWVDTGDRLTPENPANLFGTLQVSNRPVLGTNSTLDNIHAHYVPANAIPDVLSWENYTFTGRMQITAIDSGIGVTVLSRYPAGVDQYYSLRRDSSHPSFYLTAHPQDVQPVRSLTPDQDTTDSGVIPERNTWYRFQIEVQNDVDRNRTTIRAKIWQDGTPEPTRFQMEAYDNSGIRIQSGTVGVWASDNGSKYFDQLNVLQDVLLSENFNSYGPDQDPTNWRDTRENNSRTADNSLFRTAQVGDAIAFGTSSNRVNIHSHYHTPESLSWSNYLYTGRMYMSNSNGGGIGVTFYSRYPNTQVPEGEHDYYYRLRRNPDNPTFHISPHRGNGNTPDNLIQGRRDSGVNPTPNTWYRFRIEVENADSRTNIRAKVWQEGTPEPIEYQIDAFDDARDRLTSGTVGLWTRSNGAKYFDDLHAQRAIFLPNRPGNWQMTGSRTPFEVDDSLFRTVNVQDNTAIWKEIDTYPLLLRPLNQNALRFDGQREYLAVSVLSEFDFSEFAIEAWIHPTQSQTNPVISWHDGTGSDTLWFGVTAENTLVLRRTTSDNPATGSIALGTTPIPSGQFTHVAVSVQGPTVTFYVNGNPNTPAPLSSTIAFNAADLELGRDGANQYFAGEIQDVRLWQTARTTAQVASQFRYQQPSLADPDLLAYWSFPETEGVFTQDATERALHLRLGGLETARRPVLIGFSTTPVAENSFPAIALDDATLQSLATIRQLQARHNLPIDRLTALWFEISHTGQADGQTLFDRVFNGRGIMGEVWSYTQLPIRWNVSGQNRQDRNIRSRLMGALQVSNEDLNRLVQWINDSATVFELDSRHLTHLYRLSQIPKVLRLTVQNFLRLLTLTGLAGVDTLEEFQQVSDRAEWLQRTGIQIRELEFLILPPSDRIPRPYTDVAIRDMATVLTNESSEFLVTSSSFVSDLVNLSQSIEIFGSLRSAGTVDELGSVSAQYQPPANLQAITSLPADLAVRQAIQTQVEDTLAQMQQEHANAVVERLSELLQVEPERLQIVSDRLNVTPSTFLGWMQAIIAMADTQPLPAPLSEYLNQLTKGLYLITRFALTTDEAIALLQNPGHFSVTDVFNPTISDLEHLVLFTELKTAFNDANGRLIHLFAQTTDLAIAEAIVNFTDWDSSQLTVLTNYFENQSTSNRIPELYRLYRAFALAETLQVDIEFLIQLANTENLSFDFYRQQADALLNVVRSRYDNEQWQRVYQPIRDRLATQRRDALLSYALTRQLPNTFQGRRDADVLYEYLLLDVQIGSEVETSRIAQGIAALQLYVQRCQLNLEQGIDPATIPTEQWNWMKNYRVWEANRKVFLYPENYIEPELRDTKTPEFEALEQELMQGEINQANIERAFNNYLNRLAELADLKIVGAYLHQETEELFRLGLTPTDFRVLDSNVQLPQSVVQAFSNNGIPGSSTGRLIRGNAEWTLTVQGRSYILRRSDNTLIVYSADSNSGILYLVGRTAMQPRRYYYRELIVNENRWLPWKGIDLTLNAEFVTPVYAFNRLFLFWVEFTTSSRQNRNLYYATIRYSYLDLNNTWVSPQTHEEVTEELEEEQRSRPQWQRVYALRTFFSIPSVADRRERLLVIYGDPNRDAAIPVKALRNAREQEAFTLNFFNQVPSPNNRLDVSLSLRYLGFMTLNLGYMTLALSSVLNQVADGVTDTETVAGLQAVLNNLFGRPQGVDRLNFSLNIEVERQSDNEWFVYRRPDEFRIRRDRQNPNFLNVDSAAGQRLGYIDDGEQRALTSALNTLNSLPSETSVSSAHMRLRDVLNDLFGRPDGINRLNLTTNFRVELVEPSDGIDEWRLIHNPGIQTLLVLQEGTRLNVYDFSSDVLDGRLRTLFGNLTGTTLNPRLPFTLENRGNNRWVITDQNNQRYLIQRQQTSFHVYEFSRAFLYRTEVQDTSINDFILAEDPTQSTESDFQNNLLLRSLPPESSLIDVNGQHGLYILDTGEEQFLINVDLNLIATDQPQFVANLPNSIFSFTLTSDPLLQSSNFSQTRFQFERLDTSAIRELSFTLFADGVDGLLSLRSQQSLERSFTSYEPTPDRILSTNLPSHQITFEGAFGLYYRELFFHIPFFIANQLNANQNFAEAQRWYHYVFNPTDQESSNGSSSHSNRYWQFLPFRNLTLESLIEILNNQTALAEYRNDPFDPHAIAQVRINAYQKAIVMRYIDNLLDWGDYLFNQNNRESIGEAAQLYILAYNLLGPGPQGRVNRKFEEIGDYNTIREVFNNNPPDFLTKFSGNGALPVLQNGKILTTFCITENADFVSFWDRVSDRLFKIRHSLNIDGVFRQLDLFQPALDVRALVQAFASGRRDISSILADINRPVPHYRYSYMLNKAREMTEIVIGLGEKLLEAIQNRDVEQLATLQNTHERNILELTTSVKRLARNEVLETLSGLQISRSNTQNRLDYFTNLIEQGIGVASLSGEEVAELTLIGSTQPIKAAVTLPGELAAAIARSMPTSIAGKVGFLPLKGVAIEGDQLGAVAEAAVAVGAWTIDILETTAGLTAKIGEYKRRLNEWRLEQRTTELDLQEIDQQIAIANIQLRIAEQEIAIHDRTIQQNQEIADFYRRKFTNEQLYNWMVSRISGLYFQAYKLAYATAKDAERAFQYEFGDNSQFINFGHWDSLRRGLLAGESLQLDLVRLEKFAIDQDNRYQEIEKIISLRSTLPEAFAILRSSGSCFFNFTERMFDEDYPGHFFRIIKSIAISVQSPALTPNQSLNATLIQLNNRTLLEPDIDAVRYLMGVEGINQPDATVVRSNWRANQQIAVSRPNRDNGMFGNFDSLLLFDDRYFPFEGTGVVSSWELEMPQASQFLNTNDSDIIIHLKYTSRSDRGAFRRAVQEELRQGGF
ncbi:hypothetical protein J5X98_10380 [Leptothermofonsia sichuanensis E412]|uniref:Tc toxin subunit A-related protein n=1 Tax=Leptothermofonsia sichuanensis TaxID=2917832 RepID=UPI001CA64347|nr:LamG-like jellyroll fold domain-containing protein [Leptothermofonsia sichuanensis]QZZ22722.1 hypothetical protein J5X98_10380 [Leptothermofonsia sichuanensis E412]